MRPVIGILPAAGRAARLAPRVGSKELATVSDGGRPRPVIDVLLTAMGAAGVERAYAVVRSAKRDLLDYLACRRASENPRVACILTPGTASIPATVDLAFPFLLEAEVAMGFPDVRFAPRTALATVIERRRRSSEDVTLALFPSDRPDKTDMVVHDGHRVSGFQVKPGYPCPLDHTWILAAWGPVFSQFLHRHLSSDDSRHETSAAAELQMSQVLVAALDAGLTVGAEVVADGRFLDVGTPEDLERAARGI